MCDACIKRASEIDTRLMRLMLEIKSDYDKLVNRLAVVMLEITPMQILHDDGLTFEELGEKEKKEVEDSMSMVSGILGIGYAVGFQTAMNSDGPQNIAMKALPLINMFQRGLEEGMAFKFVINKGMH